MMFIVSDSENMQQEDKQTVPIKVKRGSKRLFIIAIAAVVLFAALFMAIFIFRPGITYGNTSGNIANGGLVAESGGWIYYSNYLYDKCLYKMRSDGSEKTKVSDEKCTFINIYDGWIYFINSNKQALIKIRIDGTGITKLADSASNLNIENGWLYYFSGHDGYIHKINTDGSEDIRLNVYGPREINVADGWIYYSNTFDDFSLYKVRVDGTDETKLNSRSSVFINVAEDYVYYTSIEEDGFYTYKIRNDGTGEVKVFDSPTTETVNVSNGWIYYGNSDDNNSLHKIRTDGMGDEKLCDSGAILINAAGGWIYYCNMTDSGVWRIKTDGTENQRVE